MKRLHSTVHILCVPVVYVCRHVPHIPGIHRHHVHISCGMVVALVGVVITKKVHEPFYLHIAADFVGYAMHAVGLAPLFKRFKLE